jgi:hypothetical protein
MIVPCPSWCCWFFCCDGGDAGIRKGQSKSDAVEGNRAGLERLLSRILKHPKLSADPDITAFLQVGGYQKCFLQSDMPAARFS